MHRRLLLPSTQRVLYFRSSIKMSSTNINSSHASATPSYNALSRALPRCTEFRQSESSSATLCRPQQRNNLATAANLSNTKYEQMQQRRSSSTDAKEEQRQSSQSENQKQSHHAAVAATPMSTFYPNDQQPHILVLGGGIIGLSSAYHLLLVGYQVTILASSYDDTTSHIAGASIVPSMSVRKEQQKEVTKWGSETIQFLKQFKSDIDSSAASSSISQQLSNDFILSIPSYEFFPSPQPLPYFSSMFPDMRCITRDEIASLLGEKHTTASRFTDGWYFTSTHVDTKVYMEHLRGRIRRLGGRIVQGKVDSLNQVRVMLHPENRVAFAQSSNPLFTSLLNSSTNSYSCIINCTGLASRSLVPDAQVIPSKGIVLRTRASIPIAYTADSDGSYIIPRARDATIGGTFGVGDESNDAPGEQVERIKEEGQKYLPASLDLSSSTILVGHRPHRQLIRVELVREQEPATGFPDVVKFEEESSHTYSLVDSAYINRLKQAETHRLSSRTSEQLHLDSASCAKLPVVHNYGHGGSGITLHVGCAREVVRLVMQVVQPKQTKITTKL